MEQADILMVDLGFFPQNPGFYASTQLDYTQIWVSELAHVGDPDRQGRDVCAWWKKRRLTSPLHHSIPRLDGAEQSLPRPVSVKILVGDVIWLRIHFRGGKSLGLGPIYAGLDRWLFTRPIDPLLLKIEEGKKI